MVAGLNEYEVKARVSPGLLAAAPIAFVVMTFGWKRYPAIAIATGVLAAVGGTFLLTILVRHVGRRIQAGLWAKWGGPPTTRFLRTRTTEGNQVQRDAWRTATQKATGVTLLSADDEGKDPVLADQTIETAIGQLTQLGQSPDYLLVQQENIGYGFERNFYGMRWFGRAISGICLGVLIAALEGGSARFGGSKVSNAAVAAGAIVDGLFLVVWIFVPSLKRTKGAADRYATQLLQATVAESRKQ